MTLRGKRFEWKEKREMALTKQQERDIQKQKDNYAKAYASKDYAGMRAANDAANAIRKQAGVAQYDSSKGDAQRAGRSGNSGSSGSSGSSGASSVAKSAGSGAKRGVSGSGGSNWRTAADDTLYRTDFDYGTAINNGLDNGMNLADLARYAKSALAKFTDPEYEKYRTDDRVRLYESLIKQADEEQEEADGMLGKIYDMTMGFENPYDEDVSDMVSKIKGRGEFSYNPDDDILYQIAAKRYAQLGSDAMNDTLAEYAAMTGGLPSSAAVSAAQQAKSKYDQELSDMIPALEQAAYQRYQGDYQMDYNLLSSLIGLQGQSYEQFADSMNRGIGIAEYLKNLEYQQGRDQVADNQWQQSFDYQVSRDNVLDEQWLMQFNEAQRQALINEAIDKRQVSVSEGNLALSRAKYNSSKSEGDSSSISRAYYAMMNGITPDGKKTNLTGQDWLNAFTPELTDEEFEALREYLAENEKNRGGSGSLPR